MSNHFQPGIPQRDALVGLLATVVVCLLVAAFNCYIVLKPTSTPADVESWPEDFLPAEYANCLLDAGLDFHVVVMTELTLITPNQRRQLVRMSDREKSIITDQTWLAERKASPQTQWTVHLHGQLSQPATIMADLYAAVAQTVKTDGHCLLIVPAEWWDETIAAYPTASGDWVGVVSATSPENIDLAISLFEDRD